MELVSSLMDGVIIPERVGKLEKNLDVINRMPREQNKKGPSKRLQ